MKSMDNIVSRIALSMKVGDPKATCPRSNLGFIQTFQMNTSTKSIINRQAISARGFGGSLVFIDGNHCFTDLIIFEAGKANE